MRRVLVVWRASRCVTSAVGASRSSSSSLVRVTPCARSEAHVRIVLTPWESSAFRLLRRAAAAMPELVELRVAGGWVRDKLLGRATGDIDVAVRHTTGSSFANFLHDFAQDAEARRGDETPTRDYWPAVSKVTCIEAKPSISRHLETATVRLDERGIDLVQLRTEDYSQSGDSRVPGDVRAGTPQQDAMRRDLTVNSLFYNLHTGLVEDHTGHGVHDLRAGLVRTPVAAGETFREDPLRALRAVRFACVLGFALSTSVREALHDARLHDALARKVSRERIGGEVAKIMRSERGVHGLRELCAADGLARAVFGDDGFAADGVRTAVGRVEAGEAIADEAQAALGDGDDDGGARAVLRLALLTWDVGRARAVIHGMLRQGRGMRHDVRLTLQLSERLAALTGAWAVHDPAPRLSDETWLRVAGVVRAAGPRLWPGVVACAALRADCAHRLPALLHGERLGARVSRLRPAADGHCVQAALRLPPGAEVGTALRQLLRLQLLHLRREMRDEAERGDKARALGGRDDHDGAAQGAVGGEAQWLELLKRAWDGQDTAVQGGGTGEAVGVDLVKGTKAKEVGPTD